MHFLYDYNINGESRPYGVTIPHNADRRDLGIQPGSIEQKTKHRNDAIDDWHCANNIEIAYKSFIGYRTYKFVFEDDAIMFKLEFGINIV